MSIEFSKKMLNPQSFLVKAKSNSGKTVGEALFFQTLDEPGIFGARVDVKNKYRKQGIATAILQVGDKIVHNEFPFAKRIFKDLNKQSYRRYTNGITDDQIIDINDSGIIFKP